VARAIDGAPVLVASFCSNAAASGFSVRAAAKVSVQVWKPLRSGPNQRSTAAAAQPAS